MRTSPAGPACALVAVVALAAAGCDRSEPQGQAAGGRAPAAPAPATAPATTPAAPSQEALVDPRLCGPWRPHSERITYDAGGGTAIVPVTTPLLLNADGTWTFGVSNGTWSVLPLTAKDWKDWNVADYGPKRGLRLVGWNGGTSVGPIEGGEERPDFVWVIYRSAHPDPGTIWFKFGRP